MNTIKKIREFSVWFVAIVFAAVAYAADIAVTINGAQSARGNLLVGLYDKPENFPKGSRLADLETPASLGGTTVTFKNVPPGKYAISVFHDMNNNHRLDVNMLGIPMEMTGASRGAMGRMGPPVFEDAAFTVGDVPIVQVINLK